MSSTNPSFLPSSLPLILPSIQPPFLLALQVTSNLPLFLPFVQSVSYLAFFLVFLANHPTCLLTFRVDITPELAFLSFNQPVYHSDQSSSLPTPHPPPTPPHPTVPYWLRPEGKTGPKTSHTFPSRWFEPSPASHTHMYSTPAVCYATTRYSPIPQLPRE